MRDLLRGRLKLGTYCRLLRNLHEIYSTLEAAIARKADNRCVALVYFPDLHRRAALVADLRALHGERWAEELALVPASSLYQRRLQPLMADFQRPPTLHHR